MPGYLSRPSESLWLGDNLNWLGDKIAAFVTARLTLGGAPPPNGKPTARPLATPRYSVTVDKDAATHTGLYILEPQSAAAYEPSATLLQQATDPTYKSQNDYVQTPLSEGTYPIYPYDILVVPVDFTNPVRVLMNIRNGAVQAEAGGWVGNVSDQSDKRVVAKLRGAGVMMERDRQKDPTEKVVRFRLIVGQILVVTTKLPCRVATAHGVVRIDRNSRVRVVYMLEPASTVIRRTQIQVEQGHAVVGVGLEEKPSRTLEIGESCSILGQDIVDAIWAYFPASKLSPAPPSYEPSPKATVSPSIVSLPKPSATASSSAPLKQSISATASPTASPSPVKSAAVPTPTPRPLK